MQYYRQYNAITDPVKHANVARLLGVNTEGLSLIQAAKASATGVKMLMEAVDLPISLKECGVDEKDLEAIAERATWNVSVESNPRRLTYDVFLEILKKAYHGWGKGGD